MIINPVEKLRQIWTPDSEVVEMVHELNPQSELDSMIRDYLSRIIIQKLHGSVTLDITDLNPPGEMFWSIVHHEPRPGIAGRREITIWVELDD